MHRSTMRMSVAFAATLALVAGASPTAAMASGYDPDAAFVSGAWEDLVVYVADTRSTQSTPVSRHGVGSSLNPGWAWSPDGSRIAYVSSASGSERLYAVRADGSGEVVLSEGPFRLNHGLHWSPDGTRIAFVSDRSGNDDVYVVDVASHEVRDLSEDPGDAGAPRWSPSGDYLGYESVTGQRDIYIVPATGGVPVNVTNDGRQSSAGTWSPDGSSYLFVADHGGVPEVYVAGADGRGPVRLTDDTGGAEFPVWSPDGSSIAFSSGEPGLVSVVGGDGRDRRRLTAEPLDAPAGSSAVSRFVAGWSPDGSTVALVVIGRPSNYPRSTVFALYVVGTSPGAQPRRIFEGRGAADVTWSPDGERILVGESGFYSVDAAVSVVTVASETTTRLLTGAGVRASWSPDGSRILLHPTAMAASSDVVVLDAAGSDPVTISASLQGPINWAPAWRPQREGPVGLVDPATGRWTVRDEWGWTRSFFYGNPGDVPFLGDWDCDGEETPGLFRPTDGYVYLRNSTTQGTADVTYYFGNPGDLPLAGDFDGDGCDTVSLYRPSEGKVYIIDRLGSADHGLGAADYSYYFGNPGDTPFVGDFDGDGIDTVGLHRSSSGFVYLRQTNTQGIADAAFFYGNPGDRIIAGDWTGDGVDTVGVFRPSEHRFYLNHTNSAGIADQAFWMGRDGWIPITGTVHPTG